MLSRKKPSAGRLTLFDLDHTLLAGDSDVLWCEFLMQRGELDPAEFAERNAAMERSYRAGSVSPQSFSQFFVSTLAGRTPSQWQLLRQDFLREVVAPRIGPAARALVADCLHHSALVILTTATNRFLTELTAAHLGIAHLIATDCEIGADGRFTGRPSGTLNMRDGKLTLLQAWLADHDLQLDEFDSWAYSDSMNDLPLLSAVRHPVVVHADPRLAQLAAERGWPSIRLHAVEETSP